MLAKSPHDSGNPVSPEAVELGSVRDPEIKVVGSGHTQRENRKRWRTVHSGGRGGHVVRQCGVGARRGAPAPGPRLQILAGEII